MRHTFRFGTRKRRPALEEVDNVRAQGGDLENIYLFDMSEGVEGLLRAVYESANRREPVTRLADMAPEKQAAMRQLYAAPGNTTLFLSRLRAGPRERCPRTLKNMSTDEIQGFEALVNEDRRYTAIELADTRRMINDEILSRIGRGDRV